MQHARDDVRPAVMDGDLPRDSAHPRIAERPGDGEQRLRRDDAVGVHRDDDVPGRAPEALGERAAFAEIFREPHRRDEPRIAQRRAQDVIPGIVPAAVVDGDDLKSLSRIARLGDRGDRVLHHRTLVVRRNDHSERRRLFFGSRCEGPVAQPEQGAHQQQHESHRDPDDRRPHPQPAPVLPLRKIHERPKERRRQRRVRKREHARENRGDQRIIPEVARRQRDDRRRFDGCALGPGFHRRESSERIGEWSILLSRSDGLLKCLQQNRA